MRDRAGWLFVLPAALILGTFHLAPILYLAWMSLFKWSFNPEAFLGLGNYAALLQDREFGQALLQTVYYAVGTIPVEMALALVIATLLFHRIAGRTFYRLLYFMPNVTSTVAAAVVFAWIFAPQAGFANFALGLLGLPPQRWMFESTGVNALVAGHFGLHLPDWAGGPSLALVAIMLFTIWHSLGFQVLLFLAGLSAIPRELHEAATADGATGWQSFRWITLPQLRPTLVFVGTISTILAFRAFNHLYVLTQGRLGDPLGTTNVATIFVFRTFYSKTQLGYASAAAMIVFAIIFILSLVQVRYRSLPE
jgi:multiple sugar transport system permease protein